MRKFKKFMAGVLSAAMVLSSATFSAFAAQTTTPATIDPALKGSLTIHKYEYNEADGSTGTGSEKDTVPTGANPLAGAGFTIYKVVDLDGMTEYYNTNPTDLPSVNTYVETDGTIKTAYADKKVGEEKLTGADGIAAFDNLDLGFYVVIETTKPDAVTTKMDPFMVSIPMTTVDGDDWLYDVHTFPKNKTTYGNIELVKTGVNDVKLEGVIFKLEKKNADGGWTEITKKAGAAGDNTGDALTLSTNAEGKISVDGLTQGTYHFIETSVGSNGGYILDKNSQFEFVVNSDGTVTYNGTTDNNISISVKNEKPDMEKKVKDRTTDTWKQETDYNIGDIIPYQVTVSVPGNITQLKEFTLTDTPNNLKDDVGSIVIKDGDTTVAEAAYTATAVDNGFKIAFNTAAMGDYAGKKLVITYNAELLTTALTTTTGNPNTAKLEYSNEILPTSDPKEPGKAVIEDHAVVYTFELKINKTGEESAPLKDVVFDLYKEVSEETAGAVKGDSANGLDSKKFWLKLDTLTTGVDGTISKEGLANGTYYLVETKTNEGYNLLKAPVKVDLNIQYVTSMTENWEWDLSTDVPTLVKHEINVSETTFTGNDTDGGTNGILTQTIVNKKGFTLPTTGGMGTVIFSIIGIILMAGAAVVLITSRKKKSA